MRVLSLRGHGNAEARGRPIVLARIVDAVRVEPELAAVEEPDRGAVGNGTGLRSEVVAGAVCVELLPAHEALGVGGGHRTDLEATETELVGPEHLTAPARRPSPVAETELRGDDHDRRLLLAGDGRERLDRARGAREPVGRELALAVVVEGARLGELLDEEVERAAVPLARVLHVREVLGRDGLDRRDGEPPLRQVGQRELREPPLDEGHGGLEGERQEGRDRRHLLADGGGAPVLGRVDPRRADLLLRVAVRDREPGEELAHPRLELAPVLDDALGAIVVEARLVDGGRDEVEKARSLRIPGRDQCRLGHRHHPSFSPFSWGRRTNNYFDGESVS